ncbi:hypothetical protein EZV62_013197 [Acer yangbiense]|uniref:Uncharacterized protein n=1 Tax=Acer yangbiense TaxID=1000413 RepID=A0A5C7HYE7_9ROSI|nr:hypothetical protein EZV62_013197 [Acer yangbiense]
MRLAFLLTRNRARADCMASLRSVRNFSSSPANEISYKSEFTSKVSSKIKKIIQSSEPQSVPTTNIGNNNPPVVDHADTKEVSGEEGKSTSEAGSTYEAGSNQEERRKVKALLSQQKIPKAIEGPNKLPDNLTTEQKHDMLEMALGTIILNLTDNVLREVNDETSACNVWKKQESLYLTKSLTNKIYLKERLFSFKMDPSKALSQKLDEFKKMTIELANVGENEKLSDENEAIILLNSLPESFRDVKAAWQDFPLT